jgi:hypothetical protein
MLRVLIHLMFPSVYANLAMFGIQRKIYVRKTAVIFGQYRLILLMLAVAYVDSIAIIHFG